MPTSINDAEVRAAFETARAPWAKLLMIDELSLGLAPVVVDRLITSISDIKAEGQVAVLLVDQDVQVAFSLADRGYVMDMGREVLQGPAAELVNNPKIKQAYLGL